MSVKVKLKLKPKELRDALDSSAIKRINQEVIQKEMRRIITSGRSPVRGEGRFPAYKDVDKYPAGQKPNRPVNLFLSGDMLRNLESWKAGIKSIAIGYRDPDAAAKATTHNKGLNGVPKRQTIPENGQEFVVSVREAIKDQFRSMIDRYLKKFKKRFR